RRLVAGRLAALGRRRRRQDVVEGGQAGGEPGLDRRVLVGVERREVAARHAGLGHEALVGRAGGVAERDGEQGAEAIEADAGGEDAEPGGREGRRRIGGVAAEAGDGAEGAPAAELGRGAIEAALVPREAGELVPVAQRVRREAVAAVAAARRAGVAL